MVSINIDVFKPNLFIVGAPKCGTTSLCYYLEQHPLVYISNPKEPFYFGNDFTKSTKPLADYLKLFELGVDLPYRGEGSTWYLFSSTAAHEIKEFNPDAKIIAMIRNPVEVLSSLLEQRLYDRTDYVTTIPEAFALESARKRGEQLPDSHWKLPKEKYYYSEVPLFAEQIQRYYDVFGKENVLVIRFEDFKNNTPAVLQSVEDFLKLPAFVEYDFTPRNQRKVLKHGWLKDMMVKLPQPMRSVLHLISTSTIRKKLFKKMDKVNQAKSQLRALDENLRQDLINRYKDQEKKLEQVLGGSFEGFVK
jgi:hypothetical protein